MSFQEYGRDRSLPNLPVRIIPDLRRQLLNAFILIFGFAIFLSIFAVVWLTNLLEQEGRPVDPRELSLFVTLFILILGIIAIVFWWFMIYRFVRPIERLVDVSEAVRWRGYLNQSEKVSLSRLSKEQTQLGILSRSLLTMEEENSRRFRELTTLLDNSRIIVSSLDVEEVIDNILGQVQALFSVERCAVLSFSPDDEHMKMVASRGMGDYPDVYNMMSADNNLASWRALRKGEPVQIADTENDLTFSTLKDRARQGRFRSVLAVPLKTHHANPAVLILYKNIPYYYSYSELELAASFANHASIAWENAALFGMIDGRLSEQTRQLGAIVDSMRDGLILESLEGEILFCNQRAADIIGQPVSRLTNQNTLQLLAPLILDREGYIQENQNGNSLETTMGQDDVELRIYFFDVTDEEQQLIGRGQLWQDITQDKALDRMKSSLVSTVSHELRTPLATIKGYVSTLLAKDVSWDGEAQREFLVTISTETDRLSRLVKDLLDISRIEGGTLQVRRSQHDLHEIIQETLLQFPKEIRTKIGLTCGKIPLVDIDSQRIHTTIRNLIENGLKYGPEDGGIALVTRYDETDQAVSVEIRDYGPGIPESYQTQIFERFYRLDDSLARRGSGVGIGLAICKGFVEAHGGKIWVVNADPGARFIFTIPVSQSA
ncbi:MAG: ATP-binding protein [Chloroflexota bacterium]